jgi:hypothetical protein
LLPPTAIAGVSVVCALGPWVFSEATALRALAAVAAATAVAGAVVMRRWDAQAGKRVAELIRARAGDEWRYEERVAELETDLEESRELRAKLEQRLRAKRAELAGLRNEHAALLRRYATAETERASALEGRRLLEIEATAPSPALPPARRAEPEPAGANEEAALEQAAGEAQADSGDEPVAYAVFSREGAWLYQQALTALARFGSDTRGDSGTDTEQTATAEASEAAESEAAASEAAVSEAVASEAAALGDTAPQAARAEAGEPEDRSAKGDTGAVATGKADPVRTAGAPEAESAAAAEDARDGVPDGAGASRSEAGAPAAQEEEAQGKPQAADEHARAAAAPMTPAEPATAAGPPPAGHFTVPTAVAVVPPAPVRRPVVEGGFDFFGTQKGAPKAALESVQNEDLADVVGQEALAVHKAEAEAGFKQAHARPDGAGQVIDLTAHDETEQIDVQGLRSAAS